MLTAIKAFFNTWQSTIIIGLVVAGGGYWWHKIEVANAVERAHLSERIRVTEELGVKNIEEAKRKLEVLADQRDRIAELEAAVSARQEELDSLQNRLARDFNRNINNLRDEMRSRDVQVATIPDDELNGAIRSVLADLREGEANRSDSDTGEPQE